MSKHFHENESDLWELVVYAESLSDSVSLSFPSDSIPSSISKEQYEHALTLLRKTRCSNIKTFLPGFWGSNTTVVFRTSGLGSNGYVFLPDHTVKLFHYDPLGSESTGFYEIE